MLFRLIRPPLINFKKQVPQQQKNAKHVDCVVVVGIVSLDKTLAHLGFHAHPTKTLTRTTTQRGIMNIINLLNIKLLWVATKFSKKQKPKPFSNQSIEDPNGRKHIKIETTRKTLDLIRLVSVKAQRLLEGLNKNFGFFQNLF